VIYHPWMQPLPAFRPSLSRRSLFVFKIVYALLGVKMHRSLCPYNFPRTRDARRETRYISVSSKFHFFPLLRGCYSRDSYALKKINVTQNLEFIYTRRTYENSWCYSKFCAQFVAELEVVILRNPSAWNCPGGWSFSHFTSNVYS
jgi:hypothetical protein